MSDFFIPGTTIALYKDIYTWGPIAFQGSILIDSIYIGTHTHMSLIIWTQEMSAIIKKIGKNEGWPLRENKRDLIDRYKIQIPLHLTGLLDTGIGDWLYNDVIQSAKIISLPILNENKKCSQCQQSFPHTNELTCDICKIIISL